MSQIFANRKAITLQQGTYDVVQGYDGVEALEFAAILPGVTSLR